MDVPTHKLVGESVRLVCRFEMEGDTLYSVKWYRYVVCTVLYCTVLYCTVL